MSSRTNIKPYMPWVMWGLGGCFYLYQFVLRVAPNVFAPDLITTFKVDAYSLGVLSAAYYYPYSALQIPLGMLTDHFGPKKLITLSIGLCVVGALLFSTSYVLWLAQAGRFIMGAGSACAFVCCLKLGSAWFTPQQFARIVGFTMIFGTTGAMGGGAPLAYLTSQFGWRTSMTLVALIGVVFMIAVWFFVKDGPEGHENHDVSEEVTSLRENLKILAKEKQSWIIMLYAMMAYVPLTVFGDLWGASFLMSAYEGIDRTAAAGAVSMMFVGIAIGAPLSTYISDQIHSRKKVIVSTAVGCLMVVGVIISFIGLLPFNSMFPLFLLLGIFIGGHYLNFVVICERHSQRVRATAASFSNWFTMSGAFIIQPVIGKILDWTSRGIVEDGIFALGDFKIALLTVPIAITLSVFFASRIEETFPEQYKAKVR